MFRNRYVVSQQYLLRGLHSLRRPFVLLQVKPVTLTSRSSVPETAPASPSSTSATALQTVSMDTTKTPDSARLVGPSPKHQQVNWSFGFSNTFPQRNSCDNTVRVGSRGTLTLCRTVTSVKRIRHQGDYHPPILFKIWICQIMLTENVFMLPQEGRGI